MSLHNSPSTFPASRSSIPVPFILFTALFSVVLLVFMGLHVAQAQESFKPGADSPISQDEDPAEALAFTLNALADRPAAPALISTEGWALNEIPANDDGSSELVTLPFPINFSGNQYSALFVNNNGNVTFNSPMPTYTPFALTGATQIPIIAPFFADVDTRGENSMLVTYGASPDGNQFVVNWVDVGYYSAQSDKLISAQLVLTQRSGVGYNDGDFDITFNYGSIGWETGSASGGSGGFGGSPVRAGYSLGTGAEGTFFELAGSGVTTAMTDGGERSLFTNSLGSLSTPGRYVFQIRGDGSAVIAGNVTGTVTDESGQPVAGAIVSIIALDGSWSSNTITGPNGTYALSGLGTGPATVRVSPPSGLSVDAPAQSVTTAVSTELTVNFTLTGPRTIPADTTIDQGFPQNSGVPSVSWGSPFVIRHEAAPGATVTFEIVQDGRTLLSGDFSESLVQPGLFTTTVPSLLGAQAQTGLAQVIIYVDGVPTTFDIYIDPAGTVVDQDGVPIVDAEVIIYRSDNPDGPFEQIPDGSALLSPSNRTNPDRTDSEGRFSWDTVPGFYRVSASAPGYLAADGTELAWTDILPVPPEHLDLILTLYTTDPGPDPTPPPTPTPDPTPDPGGSSTGSSVLDGIVSVLSGIGGMFKSIFDWILSFFSRFSS